MKIILAAVQAESKWRLQADRPETDEPQRSRPKPPAPSSSAMVRLLRDPSALRVEHLKMMGPAGNSAMADMVKVGGANDPAEADAERRGARALRATGGGIRPSGGGGAAGPGRVARDSLRRAASGGHTLPHGMRRQMEAGVGADLSGVRMHTGREAARLAGGLGAKALTHGNDVYFAQGAYQPSTAEGQHVIAHEMGHVAQGAEGVHRFPATAFSAPVDWSQETGGVQRPGGGMSGGIYILQSRDPNAPVKKAVVKPVFGIYAFGKETGDQLSFGDQALKSLLGVSTPVSRVVGVGSREYSQLQGLVGPYAPKAREGMTSEDVRDFRDISQARSFVVMGAVENANTISGYAQQAGGDTKAMATLHQIVFDPRFLERLARMAVGDILIGNVDRITSGGRNLGNIMVSQQDGQSNVYAIDSTALLPSEIEPSTLLRHGTGVSRDGVGAKANLQDPGAVVEEFFRGVIAAIEQGTPQTGTGGGTQTGDSPGQTFQRVYEAQKERILTEFRLAWHTALIDVYALVNTQEGRDKMKDLTDQYQGGEGQDQVSYDTLSRNARVLGSMGAGEDLDSTLKNEAAQAAFSRLQQVRPEDLVSAIDPEMAPQRAGALPPEAASAQLESPSMPTSRELININTGAAANKTGDPQRIEQVRRQAGRAREELSELGTKRSFFSKQEKPRNRVLAGNFVADATVVGAGSYLVGNANKKVLEAVDMLKYAIGGRLEPSQISALRWMLTGVPNAARSNGDKWLQYAAAFRRLAADTRRLRNYDDAPGLTEFFEVKAERFAQWGTDAQAGPYGTADLLAGLKKALDESPRRGPQIGRQRRR